MYTGKELAHQIPIVARNAQFSANIFGPTRRKAKAPESRRKQLQKPLQACRAAKIRLRRCVRRNVVDLNAEVSDEEKWGPENRRADREVIVEMAVRGVFGSKDMIVRIQPAGAKALVGRKPVLLKIKPVLDEHGAGVRVVADAVTANPGITEGKRQKKKDDQDLFVFVRLRQATALSLLAIQFSSCDRRTGHWLQLSI